MKSATLPSFWEAYALLDRTTQRAARKAFSLWAENPFHRSLRFKCINDKESIWAARISIGYRVVGVMQDETITWFWIGGHDEYERFFG